MENVSLDPFIPVMNNFYVFKINSEGRFSVSNYLQ